MIGRQQKQAVLYGRVASISQKAKAGRFEPQLTRCKEFARTAGFAVVASFTEQGSGLVAERPSINAMLDFLRQQPATGTAVIIDDISRLARSIPTHLKLRKAISEVGGVLMIARGKDEGEAA